MTDRREAEEAPYHVWWQEHEADLYAADKAGIVRAAFKAGAASRQAEIEKLKTELRRWSQDYLSGPGGDANV
jgi:hypothetical protein